MVKDYGYRKVFQHFDNVLKRFIMEIKIKNYLINTLDNGNKIYLCPMDEESYTRLMNDFLVYLTSQVLTDLWINMVLNIHKLFLMVILILALMTKKH